MRVALNQSPDWVVLPMLITLFVVYVRFCTWLLFRPHPSPPNIGYRALSLRTGTSQGSGLGNDDCRPDPLDAEPAAA